MPVDDDAGAAVARRRLGTQLRKMREATRNDDGSLITLEQAAEYMERARPTLYRIENGKAGVRIKNHDITALCTLYRADSETERTLLALAAATRVRGWFHRYSDVLPPGFDMYVGLEAAAASVFAYEGERVHGLMQTAEYAREIVRNSAADDREPSPAEVERRVELRMRRQDILTRDDRPPAELVWVLGEAVLRRVIGSPKVMARQLDHINERGELPNVTVQVVPFDVGAHDGIHTGPFAILRFFDDIEPPTAYMDNFMGHLLTHKAPDVARFDTAAAAIRRCALDEQASRDVIHATAKELSRA